MQKNAFQTPKNVKKIKGKTIYVGNLSYTATEKQLYKMFCKFGKVTKVNLIKVPGTEKHKGICFVHMFKPENAELAIKFFDGKVIDGRTLKVSEAEESSNTSEPTVKLTKKFPKKEQELPTFVKRPKKKTGLDELFSRTGKNL